MFARRRVQRLFPKSPNVCAYFALGWVRVERYIEIKKPLFVHSILPLNGDNTTKIIFIQRAKEYFNNAERRQQNMYRSNVYDFLNTASIFSILDDVKNMVGRGHRWSRAHWREMLWRRAWELDEVSWCLKARCLKNLDLLTNICTSSRSLIWWQLADKLYGLFRDCEVMVKLLSHAGLLKTDDVRLKSLPLSQKFCN